MERVINVDLLYQLLGQKEERIALLVREMAQVISAKDKEIKALKEEIEGLERDEVVGDQKKTKKGFPGAGRAVAAG